MKKWDAVPDRTLLEKSYKEWVDTYYQLAGDIARKVEQELLAKEIRASTKFRVKSFSSYFKKIVKKLRESKGDGRPPIGDIVGIRIVCPFLETIDEVEKLIKSIFTVVEVRKKGLNHSFREFGYEATHLLIKFPVPPIDPEGNTLETAEVQIRTILQEAWSEVEHELVYKAGIIPFDHPLKRKLAALNANLTLADIIFQDIRGYQRQLQAELKEKREKFSKSLSQRTFFTGMISLEKENAEPILQDNITNDEKIEKNNQTGEDQKEDELEDYTTLSLDDMLLQGLLAHNNGEYKKAMKIYTLLLKEEDQVIRALVYSHRGVALFAESRYEEAVDDFSNTLIINPKSSRNFYLRGISYRMMKNYSAALEDLQKAVSLDPYQPDFWFAKSQLYFHSGDYFTAREDCAAAINLEPLSEEYNQFMKLIHKKSNL